MVLLREYGGSHGGGGGAGGSSSYTASRLPPELGGSVVASSSSMEDPILTDMMDYYLVRKSESYKFIRMADDLHDVASYLNEMRICFLLLTGTVYIILAIYFVSWCVRRNRRRVNSPTGTGGSGIGRNRLPNHRWAAGELQGTEYENAVTAQTNIGQTEDLVSVRSDGALPNKAGGQQLQQHVAPVAVPGPPQFGMAGRNRQQAPSFMRHSAAGSMQNHRWATEGGAAAPSQQSFEDACSGTAAATAQTALLGPGGQAATRLMDTNTGTLITKQQQQHQQHIGHQHHSPHHHQQQQQQPSSGDNNDTAEHQHQQHQQLHQQLAQQLPATTTTGGRSPGCLLNNIAEEREREGSSGSSSLAPGPGTPGGGTTTATAAGPAMSTFGWRNKEKMVLERHELQPLAGNSTDDIC